MSKKGTKQNKTEQQRRTLTKIASIIKFKNNGVESTRSWWTKRRTALDDKKKKKKKRLNCSKPERFQVRKQNRMLDADRRYYSSYYYYHYLKQHQRPHQNRSYSRRFLNSLFRQSKCRKAAT